MVCFIRPISTTGCGITSSRFKKLAIALGASVIALTIFAFSIPRDYHYKKETDIFVQDRMAFVFIGDLKRWNEWSLWAARDPKIKTEYSDPAWGVGSTYRWTSNKFGEGEIKITQFTAANSLAYDMIVPGADTSHWEFKMRPHPRQGIIVSWTVDGQYPENRFWRLVAYIKMWCLPYDIQEGLARLKGHAEKHEAYDVSGPWENIPTPIKK